ncbi:hypothetical protein K469DRAFT_543196 [Zopfia rhizophila CBS 207.26]|uniref:Uncharacterized protein n=1 Tax=Zopfia rhizophila CBS 207.26 TaxID=1314779 RepID=A0A6A6EUT4_9PEZI|nr:hypothetical protein K469DRAFT_543196 [Zopfia rhizophila CBS 207.26]
MSIDAAILGVTTFKEVKGARKEQQEYHEAQIKTTSAVKNRVDKLHKDHQTHINATLSVRNCVDQLHERHDNREYHEEYQAILDWLTPLDYAPQQNDFISRRQEGTGQWLLDSKEFKDWLSETKQTLFCPGMPGAGKTIITSIVVNHLHATFQNDHTVAVAYLYCNFRRQHEQRPTDLLLSLLRQLIQEQSYLTDSLKDIYNLHKKKRTRPSFDEISKALHSVIANYSRTFIIMDTLDECQVSNKDRKKFLLEIFKLQTQTTANIFATSRFIPEVEKEFEGSISVEIRATSDDVQRYLEGQMSRLPSFVSRNVGLQEEIKAEISKAVDGMFLLTQLHLASLTGKRSPKAVRIVLEKLSAGSDAYDHAYKEAMERIEGQVTDSQKLAKQVLSWITCAKRRLKTPELQHALAVEIGASKLNDENLPEIEDIVSVCAGLVTIDEESDIIRLVHHTTQEYFERTWASWFPNVQTEITETCVTYLSFYAFEAGFCPADRVFEARLHLNPLYDYAARNWGHHAHGNSIEADQLIVDFLESEAKVAASSQAIMVSQNNRYGYYSQRVPQQMKGVHLAAYFGLEDTLMALLKDGLDADSKDSYGRTPLSWAAINSHEAVVKLLLQEDGVDVDSKSNSGQTPLLMAAENGHEAVVKLLLEKDGVDVNSKSNSGQTPLSWAAENGHEAVVKLLLAKKVVPEPKDIYGETPLSKAAFCGHQVVVELLLATPGVKSGYIDYDGRQARGQVT